MDVLYQPNEVAWLKNVAASMKYFENIFIDKCSMLRKWKMQECDEFFIFSWENNFWSARTGQKVEYYFGRRKAQLNVK